MSDTDTEFDFETDEGNDPALESPNEETKAKRGRPKGKRKKHPIPTGWETPSDLAIRIEFEGYLGTDDKGEPVVLDATYIYSLANNEKNDFPSTKHTDERLIVEIEPAIKWLQERRSEFAERAKLREQRAANRDLTKYRSITKGVAYFADAARS